MTLQELHKKDVINIRTGENLGRPDDLTFRPQDALVQGLVLRGRPRLFGLLGKGEDLRVDWSQIVTIGADTVLVELPDSGPAPEGTLFQLKTATVGRPEKE